VMAGRGRQIINDCKGERKLIFLIFLQDARVWKSRLVELLLEILELKVSLARVAAA
jgi:hypothetical protein